MLRLIDKKHHFRWIHYGTMQLYFCSLIFSYNLLLISAWKSIEWCYQLRNSSNFWLEKALSPTIGGVCGLKPSNKPLKWLLANKVFFVSIEAVRPYHSPISTVASKFLAAIARMITQMWQDFENSCKISWMWLDNDAACQTNNL